MFLNIRREELENAGKLHIFELTPKGELTITWEPSFLCGTRQLISEEAQKTLDRELGKAETSAQIEKFIDSLGRAAFMRLLD